MAIATALPCRIAVYEEDDETILSTIRPTTMLEMFEAPDVSSVAREVEDTMTAIMTEAASRA